MLRVKLYHYGLQSIHYSRWAILTISIFGILDVLFPYAVEAVNFEQYRITSLFGETNSVHLIPHNGLDIAMPVGSKVDSIISGKVVAVLDEGNRSWGKSVHIEDSQGNRLIYGHLSEIKVRVGEMVQLGDTVALSGNTGKSTGPHLHIQININGKPIDPMPTVQKASILSKLAQGK